MSDRGTPPVAKARAPDTTVPSTSVRRGLERALTARQAGLPRRLHCLANVTVPQYDDAVPAVVEPMVP